MKPAVAVDRKKVRPPAAVAVGAPDIGHPRYAGDVYSDPEKTAASDLVTGSDVASGLHDPRGLQRRRLRPYPPGCSQRRHAPLDRRRGDGQHRPACIAIPTHRQRTAASRSRLSPDRAAPFTAGLEERVWRLHADSFALAAESDIRPHRLWTHADRRAAPLAFIAIRTIDGRCAQRSDAVRAVLCRCRPRARSRPET